MHIGNPSDTQAHKDHTNIYTHYTWYIRTICTHRHARTHTRIQVLCVRHTGRQTGTHNGVEKARKIWIKKNAIRNQIFRRRRYDNSTRKRWEKASVLQRELSEI